MSGRLKHLIGHILQPFNVPLANRAVNHARLAETASADAAALDFKRHAVLNYLKERNNRFLRVYGVAQIGNNLLLNSLRHVVILRRKVCNRSVLIVSHVIKRRHVHSGNV